MDLAADCESHRVIKSAAPARYGRNRQRLAPQWPSGGPIDQPLSGSPVTPAAHTDIRVWVRQHPGDLRPIHPHWTRQHPGDLRLIPPHWARQRPGDLRPIHPHWVRQHPGDLRSIHPHWVRQHLGDLRSIHPQWVSQHPWDLRSIHPHWVRQHPGDLRPIHPHWFTQHPRYLRPNPHPLDQTALREPEANTPPLKAEQNQLYHITEQVCPPLPPAGATLYTSQSGSVLSFRVGQPELPSTPHRAGLSSPSEWASRRCGLDGEWAAADYTACHPLLLSQPCAGSGSSAASASIEAASVIYLTGYSASLLALGIATAIFRHFK